MGDCCSQSKSPILLITDRQVNKSKIDIYVIDKVKEKRLERNLSQADLAYELGMSVGFIGKVESMKYTTHYNIKHLNELAKILKCNPQEFLPKKPV